MSSKASFGAFFYRKNRFAGFKVSGMLRKVDDRDLNAACHLEEWHRNPRAAVAVGVCYRVNENLKGSAPWPHAHFNGVSEAVCSEQVRIVGGVFERPSQQAAEVGRCFAATKASLVGPLAVPCGTWHLEWRR